MVEVLKVSCMKPTIRFGVSTGKLNLNISKQINKDVLHPGFCLFHNKTGTMCVNLKACGPNRACHIILLSYSFNWSCEGNHYADVVLSENEFHIPKVQDKLNHKTPKGPMCRFTDCVTEINSPFIFLKIIWYTNCGQFVEHATSSICLQVLVLIFMEFAIERKDLLCQMCSLIHLLVMQVRFRYASVLNSNPRVSAS